MRLLSFTSIHCWSVAGGIIVPEDESENDDQEPLLTEHNGTL